MKSMKCKPKQKFLIELKMQLNLSNLNWSWNPSRPTGQICKLCIQVDHEFTKAYGPTMDDLAPFLQRTVDHASWIFRATDWNNDGKPDNIGFKLASVRCWNYAAELINFLQSSFHPFHCKVSYFEYKVKLGWKLYIHEESKEDYDTPKPALDLLKAFARYNFSRCCLGIGLTNRPFQDWTA